MCLNLQLHEPARQPAVTLLSPVELHLALTVRQELSTCQRVAPVHKIDPNPNPLLDPATIPA